MVLSGTIVNGVLILIGTIFGLLFSKIPEQMKHTIMSGIALTVMLIGLQMALQTAHMILVLLSLLTAAVLGELLKLDDKLNRLGLWIEQKFKKTYAESTVAEAFVTASLIFVIGAMAVLGALDSGLRNDHEVLITKGVIDG